MKIKKEIKKKYSWEIEKFRFEMTSLIITACKETGIDHSIDIQFTQMLMLHTTKVVKRKGEFSHFETETILADRISWSPHHDFFILGFADKYVKSSDFLSLDGLCCVFEEMKNVLQKK
jgi:hypothetical protein